MSNNTHRPSTPALHQPDPEKFLNADYLLQWLAFLGPNMTPEPSRWLSANFYLSATGPARSLSDPVRRWAVQNCRFAPDEADNASLSMIASYCALAIAEAAASVNCDECGHLMANALACIGLRYLDLGLDEYVLEALHSNIDRWLPA